jgi:hypothetical protein
MYYKSQHPLPWCMVQLAAAIVHPLVTMAPKKIPLCLQDIGCGVTALQCQAIIGCCLVYGQRQMMGNAIIACCPCAAKPFLATAGTF